MNETMIKNGKQYQILTSSAHMPNNCWSIYRNVAIVESPIGIIPKRIANERGCRVVATWPKNNVGKTEKCAYKKALLSAEKYMAEIE